MTGCMSNCLVACSILHFDRIVLLELLKPNVLLPWLLGMVFGVFVGATPGLTATMAVALIVPLFVMVSTPAPPCMPMAAAISSDETSAPEDRTGMTGMTSRLPTASGCSGSRP